MCPQVFRHGDRTPDIVYPNMPYTDDDYFPDGVGGLTNVGSLNLLKKTIYLLTKKILIWKKNFLIKTKIFQVKKDFLIKKEFFM